MKGPKDQREKTCGDDGDDGDVHDGLVAHMRRMLLLVSVVDVE